VVVATIAAEGSSGRANVYVGCPVLCLLNQSTMSRASNLTAVPTRKLGMRPALASLNTVFGLMFNTSANCFAVRAPFAERRSFLVSVKLSRASTSARSSIVSLVWLLAVALSRRHYAPPNVALTLARVAWLRDGFK